MKMEYTETMRNIIILALIVSIYLIFKGWVSSFRKNLQEKFAQATRSGFKKNPDTSELVQDPECGTYVSMEQAVQRSMGGTVHYFCSPECAEHYAKKVG